ncbi:MAG: STAS domain-containing protein [Bdellovibrionales bacterium]
MMRYNISFSPDTLHIEIAGVLDFMDSLAFNRMMNSLKRKSENEYNKIQINMVELVDIDSTGKRLLMRAHDFAKKTRCHLTFCEAHGPVLAFLESAAKHNNLDIA